MSGGASTPPPTRAAFDGSLSEDGPRSEGSGSAGSAESPSPSREIGDPHLADLYHRGRSQIAQLRKELGELQRRSSRERTAQQATHAGRCAGLLQEVAEQRDSGEVHEERLAAAKAAHAQVRKLGQLQSFTADSHMKSWTILHLLGQPNIFLVCRSCSSAPARPWSWPCARPRTPRRGCSPTGWAPKR